MQAEVALYSPKCKNYTATKAPVSKKEYSQKEIEMEETVKELADKFNTGKPRLSLIPVELFTDLLNRFEVSDIGERGISIVGFFTAGLAVSHSKTEAEMKERLVNLRSSMTTMFALHPEGVTVGAMFTFPETKILIGFARSAEFGIKKYGRNNWKRGFRWSEICDSMLRHALALLDGEEIDPDSGLHHLDHIPFSYGMLVYMFENKTGINDIYEEEVNEEEDD